MPALVSGSAAEIRTNFVSSETLSIDCGSSSDRLVAAVVTAYNGDDSGTRQVTSATYGGVALTVTAVQANAYGKYVQLVYGMTSLTGANNLVINTTNNSGMILAVGAAFSGVGSINDITLAQDISGSCSWTVDSDTTHLVAALLVMSSGANSLTGNDGASAISGYSTYGAGLTETGASPTRTIDGTFGSTEDWLGFGFSLGPTGSEAALSGSAVTGGHGTASPGTSIGL